MSNKIDQRIVEMSFENHKFEKGILESKNSLKEFSNALKNTGTGKSFNGLEDSIGSISKSFSMMEQIGIGALRRIGEMAVNAGTNMFTSLAIEPITQGFDEMELKMNSTQTIMASTGETLAVVNSYLDELNEYSDRTIYSFSDMTQNIGKFTNAGVKLDLAVASIKGVSNAAALAGANAQEASRAMYNFAQALSAGYVKLIDWKSIENANMATVEFKNQLLEAGVAAGTVAKSADGMYKVLGTNMAGKTMDGTISATRNFNESLSYQWMTTEVLTKTLADYADETTEIGKRAMEAATKVTTFSKLMDTLKESVGSGWARTFELMFGDFHEARDLWTGMNDSISVLIETMSDARNDLLTGGLGSGWKQFIKEGISNVDDFENTIAIVAGEAGINIDKIVEKAGTMEKAVRESFTTGLSLKDLRQLKAFGELTQEEFQKSWVSGEILTQTISRMSDKIKDLSGEELRNAGYTEKSKNELFKLRDALLSGAISADNFAKKMAGISGRENIIVGLKNSVIALLKVIKPISKAFDQIFPPKTAQQLYDATENFKNFTKQLTISEETSSKIQRTLAGVFSVIDIGLRGVKFLGSAFMEIVKIFVPVGGGILDVTASIGDFLVAINKTIKSSNIFQYGLLAIKVAVLLVKNAITNVIGKVSDFIHVLRSTDKPLEVIGDTIKKVFGNLFNTIKMVTDLISKNLMGAIKTVSNFINSKIDSEDNNVFSSILDVLKSIVDFISDKASFAFSNLSEIIRGLDFNKISSFVIGGTLLIFVGQISQLTKSVSNLTDSATGIINKLSKKIFGSTTKIKDLAYAFGILSASLFVLSKIPWDELKYGLIGLGGAMLIFVTAYAGIETVNVIASKMLKDKDMVKTAFNLVSLASGLAVMAGALKIISSIKDKDIWQSVGVVFALTAFLTVYQGVATLLSKYNNGKLSVSIMGMATGLLMMIAVIKIIDKVDETELVSGGLKVGGMLIVIGVIELLFGAAAKIGSGNKLATSILSMSSGLLLMVALIKIINHVSNEEILQGMFKVTFISTMIAVIQALFGTIATVDKGQKVAVSILGIAGGVLAMMALVKAVNLLTADEILMGSIKIGFMMSIVALMQALFASASNLGKGNISLSILTATASMALMTGLISIINVYTDDQIDKGIMTLGRMALLIGALQFFVGVSSAISDGNASAMSIASITVLLVAVAGLVALLSTIPVESLDAASNAMMGGAVAVGVIIAALTLFSHVGSSSAPVLMGLASSFVVFAAGVALAGAGVILAGAGFKLGAEAVSILVSAFGDLLNIVGDNRDTLVSDFGILGSAIAEGIFQGIKTFISNIGDELKNIWSTILTSVKSFFGIRSPSTVMAEVGTNMSSGLWDGLKNGLTGITDKIQPYLSGITDKVKGIVSSVSNVGKDLVDSIGNGIKRNRSTATLAGINMAEGVENSIRRPLQVYSLSPLFSNIGEWIPESLKQGIINGKQQLLNTANSMGINTGLTTTDGLAEGISTGSGSVTTAIDNLINLLTNKKKAAEITNESKDAGTSSGNAYTDAYSKAVSSPKAYSATKAVAKSAFEIFKESIDEKKNYNLISLEEELAEWERFSKKYAKGTKNRMNADKELARVRQELDTKSFNHSKKWIEDEKYYKRLSLLDELAAWERVQARYKEGHQYRMQAERELFRLKNELKEAEYQNSLDWIDQEKYYGRLSLLDELAAWKRVMNRYPEFDADNTKSKERKNAEREVYRVQKEINDKRKQLEDDYYAKTKEVNNKLIRDIENLNEKYDDSLKSRTQSLASAWGLFDEVTKSEQPVSGKQLLSNLEGQVIAFSSWQDQLDALRKKGVSGVLIDELESMGPQSLEQIKALNQLSEPELDRYTMLWQKKHRQARTQAESELIGLRRDTDKQIAKLTNDAEAELDEYRITWQKSMSEIDQNAVKTTTKTITKVLSLIPKFATSAVSAFKQLKGDLKTTVQNGSWEETGKQIPAGIAKGIASGSVLVFAAIKAMTSGSTKKTEQGFEIKSPSRVGIRIGENYVSAIGSGMNNMIPKVVKPSEKLAKATVDILREAIDGINDILDYDYDLEPTISPIIDLSDVDSKLNQIFGATRELALSKVAIKTTDDLGMQEILSSARKRTAKTSDEGNVNNTVNNKNESKIEIVNNYSVRNDNDIRKISRDQKNLLDRYNLARGVTN